MDRYLDPPDTAPEIDGDDEERLLLNCLRHELREAFGHLVDITPGIQMFNRMLDRDYNEGDERLFKALVEHYRTEINEAWAEEHRKPDPGDRADYDYERRRDDRLTEI